MQYILDHEYEPVRGHETDAGLDLRTPVPVMIKAHSSERVDLGIHFDIPAGWYGRLESKSGLNVNEEIFCGGGVIDSGYTGSVVARLYNFSDHDYQFEIGDKFVQIVFLPISTPRLIRTDHFEPTERGDSGFGSTGR